jgi:hypothetical protein
VDIAKKTKKKKLWFDNECELKYKHLKGLARNLCNNHWDNFQQTAKFILESVNLFT